MRGKNHRELQVWQKAMQVTEDVYKVVKLLPKEETYALSDQMRRAAVSIPSNIAEGNARGTNKETIHFLYIAQGSRAEVETQMELCFRIGYIDEETMDDVIVQLQEIGRMISGLIKSLTSNLSPSNLSPSNLSPSNLSSSNLSPSNLSSSKI